MTTRSSADSKAERLLLLIAGSDEVLIDTRTWLDVPSAVQDALTAVLSELNVDRGNSDIDCAQLAWRTADIRRTLWRFKVSNVDAEQFAGEFLFDGVELVARHESVSS